MTFEMTPEPISLELSRDEALVLFEVLHRWADTDRLEFVDEAEQRAMWNLSALLERLMAEPFRPDYDELLAAARDRLRDEVVESEN
jgi:hypothetical protein